MYVYIKRLVRVEEETSIHDDRSNFSTQKVFYHSVTNVKNFRWWYPRVQQKTKHMIINRR